MVQPTARVEETNAIESRGDVQAVPPPSLIRCPRLCRLIAGAFLRVGGEECPAVGCRSVTAIHRAAEQEWSAELRATYLLTCRSEDVR